MAPPWLCVFDAYGTLFSVRMPVEELNAITNGQGEALLEIWRRKQLEYTWLRGMMKAYVPFEQVTNEALTYAMRELGLSDPILYELMMPIYLQPQTFPDVLPALERLKSEGIATAILSNGTLHMLQEGARRTGIAPYLDQLLSVDQVQQFKPAAEVYQMALDAFGAEPAAVRFFSSNQWDITGAGHFGLPTVWVNRYDRPAEVLKPAPAYTISDLSEITDLLQRA